VLSAQPNLHTCYPLCHTIIHLQLHNITQFLLQVGSLRARCAAQSTALSDAESVTTELASAQRVLNDLRAQKDAQFQALSMAEGAAAEQRELLASLRQQIEAQAQAAAQKVGMYDTYLCVCVCVRGGVVMHLRMQMD